MAPKSTVLTPAEEAIVVVSRQKTPLTLDDMPGGLGQIIPNLSRSALRRCLQRHGVSRSPVEEIAEKRERFKTCEKFKRRYQRARPALETRIGSRHGGAWPKLSRPRGRIHPASRSAS